MVRIRKGIPIPDPTLGGNVNRGKYPWRSMEVGDSFHVPFQGRDPFAFRAQLMTNGRHMAKRIKNETGEERTFVAGIRTTGVRVWRTK